mmetsp:Transcript_16981/g.40899  ORF Transcript_16981/g.40899 Transcript_16981/m.40899 type:complete len:729 (+) Transcript_16981:74-2260(+)
MRWLLMWLMVAAASAVAEDATANPIRRVVNLLQGLRGKIEEEGDKDKELYEKFMCNCDKTTSQLSTDVADGKEQLTRLAGRIEELSGSNAQLEAEIKEIEAELAEDEKSVEEATKVRNGEAKAFADEASGAKNSLGALDKAIAELRKGLGGESLLQTLRSTIGAASMSKVKDYLAQLDEAAQEAPTGGSAQILGVLEQMRDNMQANLDDATKDENEAVAVYEQLMASKGEEIKAAKTELDEKKSRLATQRQGKADAEEEIEDVKSGLQSDETMLIETKRGCKQRTEEFEGDQKQRMTEIQGIMETIKILNDDDTLELLKKTLPSPSFVQTSIETHDHRAHTVKQLLKKLSQPNRGYLSLLMLQSTTTLHQDKFAALKKMIQNMITDLKQEQHDEDHKRDYCKKDINAAEDDGKESEGTINVYKQKMAESETEQQNLAQGISKLKGEIQDIQDDQTLMTLQRKKENGEYSKTMSDLTVAVGLLKKAKDRLGAVFNGVKKGEGFLQTQGGAAPVADAAPSAEQQDSQMSDMLGLSFVQEDSQAGQMLEMDSGAAVGDELSQALLSEDGTSQQHKAQVAGPQSDKKAAGILVMLEELIGELKASQASAETQEKAAQGEYDNLMAESDEAKKIKKKDLTNKEALKSREKEIMMDLKKKKAEESEALHAIVSKLHALHDNCDKLLKEYYNRKKVRTGDVETLQQSIAILSGANLLQLGTRVRRVAQPFLEDSP